MQVTIGKNTYTAEQADIDIKTCNRVIRAEVVLGGKCEKMIVAGDFDADCRDFDNERHIVIAGIAYRLVFKRGVLYVRGGIERKLVPLHTYNKDQAHDPRKIYQVKINKRDLVTVDESESALRCASMAMMLVAMFFVWFGVALARDNAHRYNDIVLVLNNQMWVAMASTIFAIAALACIILQ